MWIQSILPFEILFIYTILGTTCITSCYLVQRMVVSPNKGKSGRWSTAKTGPSRGDQQIDDHEGKTSGRLSFACMSQLSSRQPALSSIIISTLRCSFRVDDRSEKVMERPAPTRTGSVTYRWLAGITELISGLEDHRGEFGTPDTRQHMIIPMRHFTKKKK